MTSYYTHAFRNDFPVANNDYMEFIFNYSMLKGLQRAGLFKQQQVNSYLRAIIALGTTRNAGHTGYLPARELQLDHRQSIAETPVMV